MYRWNAEDYSKHSAGQEQWARELIGQAGLMPDDRVLDVGCGDGRHTAAIASLVPAGTVLGVDLSPDMVRHAADHFPASSYPNLGFAQRDARTSIQSTIGSPIPRVSRLKIALSMPIADAVTPDPV